MTGWSHDGLRAPPSESEDFRGFSTLKKSLSAVSSRRSRSKSPIEAGEMQLGLERDSLQDDQKSAKPLKDPQLFVDIPKMPQAAEAALNALQYLPTPLLVLSSLKTVILANEAMGRLLGLDTLDSEDESEDHEQGPDRTLDLLGGQSLSQIGIDVIEDGQSMWVSWEVGLEKTRKWSTLC